MIERVNTVIVRVNTTIVWVNTVTVKVNTMTVRVNTATVLTNTMTVRVNSVAERVISMTVRVKTVAVLINTTTVRVNTVTGMVISAGLQVVPAAKITRTTIVLTLSAPFFPSQKLVKSAFSKTRHAASACLPKCCGTRLKIKLHHAITAIALAYNMPMRWHTRYFRLKSRLNQRAAGWLPAGHGQRLVFISVY
jgi:hypothetical protein